MTAYARKRFNWVTATAVGLVLLLGIGGQLTPYKRVENWMCPVSGSARRQTTWFGCFRREERTVTALELWLKRREPSFEPQWRSTSTQTYRVLSHSCGTGGAPEICQLRPILDDIVSSSSDERIAELVAVLRGGSRQAKQQAIKRIADDYFATH
jgi:hypothetical protein